jgi:hypothetical protein
VITGKSPRAGTFKAKENSMQPFKDELDIVVPLDDDTKAKVIEQVVAFVASNAASSYRLANRGFVPVHFTTFKLDLLHLLDTSKTQGSRWHAARQLLYLLEGQGLEGDEERAVIQLIRLLADERTDVIAAIVERWRAREQARNKHLSQPPRLELS